MDNNSDIILIKQTKKRNEKAFTSIFNKYWDELFISAFFVLKDEDVCKDIVQEIFVSFWNRCPELEIINLRAYLLQATKYQVAKYIRDNQKYEVLSQSYENIETVEFNEEPIEYKELHTIISQKINTLPERCREVFRLSRLEGLSNKQIGEKLNISVSTVENQITKALKFLRHELSGYTTLLSLVFFFHF